MAKNLDQNIADLTRQVQNLAMAIGMMGESKDILRNITTALGEKLEKTLEEKRLAGESVDLGEQYKDILKKVIEEEKEKLELSTDLNKQISILESAVEKAAKSGIRGAKLFDEIDKNLREMSKSVITLSGVLKREQAQAIGLAKEDINTMMKKLASSGWLGKLAKFAMLAFVGQEKLMKRGRVERGMAIAAHPGLFPGEEGAAAGTLAKLIPLAAKLLPVIAAISMVVAMWWENFKSIQAVSANLVKTTGFTANNIGKLAEDIIESSVSLRYFNISLDEIQTSAVALGKEFKNVQQLTRDSIETVTILSKMTGVSADHLARFYKIMSINWRLTDKSVRNVTLNLRDQARVYGLDFAGIMQDIVANAENLTMLFGKSTKHLERAAVKAAMMQTSLSNQTQVLFKFAHWADAIQNSFMLSVVAQKQFNAASLYTKAVLGDVEGVINEIMDGLASSADSWEKIVPMAMQVSQTLGIPFEEIKTMMESRTIEKMLSAMGISAAKMGYAIRAVREIAVAKGTTAFDVARDLKNNMGELTKSMQKSMQLEEELKRNRKSDLAKTGEDFAKGIGLRETMDPIQQILASMAGFVNKIFTQMSTVIVPAMQPLADLANYLLRKETPGDIKTRRIMGGHATSWFQHGGITKGPSIVGEVAPEAVLPLTGPGRTGFTEPFLVSSVISPIISEIKNALANISKVPIEVKVYLDSAVLAEKLERYQLMAATR